MAQGMTCLAGRGGGEQGDEASEKVVIWVSASISGGYDALWKGGSGSEDRGESSKGKAVDN